MSWICTAVTKSSFVQQTGGDHGCRGPLGGPVWSQGRAKSVSAHAGCPAVSSQGWISRFDSLGKSWRASCELCFQAHSSSCNSSKIKEGAEAISRDPERHPSHGSCRQCLAKERDLVIILVSSRFLPPNPLIFLILKIFSLL